MFRAVIHTYIYIYTHTYSYIHTYIKTRILTSLFCIGGLVRSLVSPGLFRVTGDLLVIVAADLLMAKVLVLEGCGSGIVALQLLVQ